MPLSVDEVRDAASDPAAGAVVIFTGAVRDHDHGRGVTALSYSAHPTAEAELAGVAEKIAASHELIALAVLHRTGDLQIGDLAVVAAVAVGALARPRWTIWRSAASFIQPVKATL